MGVIGLFRLTRAPSAHSWVIEHLESVTEMFQLCTDFAHALEGERVFPVVSVVFINRIPQTRSGFGRALKI
jgi:hypothetical protein